MNFKVCVKKNGAVLPLVLGILLTVTILLTSLLQMPGGVRRVAMHRAQMQQQIYDAESALIAYLEGFPEHFFEREPWNVMLPKVERSRLGPWADLSASVSTGEKRIHVMEGIVCDSGCNMLKSPKLRREIYEGFKQQLNHEIMMVKPPLILQMKSGNRRIFSRDALGRDIPPVLWVQEGDLSLDIESGATEAKQLSGRFIADGSIEVRGSATFDTLRVYARGPLYLRGSVKVRWLEAFSEDRIEISSGVEFSGAAVARHEVAFGNPARPATMRYPSFVMSAESSEIPAVDSVLVPDFIPGDLIPFQWSLGNE